MHMPDATLLLVQMMDCDGEQVNHLGSALLSFLRRYGVSFNRNQHAVAVKLGGVVERRQLGSGFAGMGKLALQDPLTGECTARLACNGTSRAQCHGL